MDKCGSIVDAIADHRHNLADVLKALDFALLVFGEHFGNHPVNADGVGDGLRGACVVAGDHCHGEVEVMELLHSVNCRWLEGVGHCDDSADLAVPTNEHCGPTLVFELGCCVVKRCWEFERCLRSEFAAADPDGAAIEVCSDAVAGNGDELGDRVGEAMQFERCGGNGVSDRVLAVGFDGAGLGEKFCVVGAVRGDDVGDHHCSLGEGAGLVEDDCREPPAAFEYFDGLDEDAELCGAARADHDRHRSCQPERTGAGDDQYGNCGVHAVADAAADHGPSEEGEQ